MHIEEIQFRAFRGQTATYSLTPATLVVGPNGSGKTTIKQAIQLAILGYIPGRSKTNRDPYANAYVGLRLSDGETIVRTYEPKERLETSLSESDIETLSTPTLDASEYFNLGPTDQVQYIFARMDLPDTHSSAGILKELEDSAFEDFDPAHVNDAKSAVKALAKEALGHGIAEGLAKLTGDKGTLATELKYWKQRVRETLGNLKISAELQTRASECSAETMGDIRTRMGQNSTALAAAQQAAGSLTQRRMTANQAVLRRKQLTDALARTPVDHTIEIARLRAAIEELQKAKWEDKDAPAFDVLQRHYMDKTEQRAAAHAVLEATTAAHAQAEDDLASIDSLTECPNCGAKSKGWKLRLATSAAVTVEAARKKMEAASADFDRIATEWETAKANADERRGIEDANRSTDRKIVSAQRELDKLESAQREDASARQSLTAELGRMTEEEGPTAEELAESSRIVQELTATARELAAKMEAATRLQHEIKQAAQGEQEHAKAKAFAAVFDDGKKKLKARQVTTIDVLFQGLVEKANWFLTGILPEPLIFRDGEIGRIVGTEFVSASDVAGFSDAERGITYVAVAAALAAQSPFKLAIIDEVKIDGGKMAMIMRRLLEAIDAGTINQAIMTHTHEPNWIHEFMPTPSGGSWKVIQLGEAVAA